MRPKQVQVAGWALRVWRPVQPPVWRGIQRPRSGYVRLSLGRTLMAAAWRNPR